MTKQILTRQIHWDAEIDTPATVAVIGGGAIGIEAALYARFLGYYVILIEAARLAQSWRDGAHLPMAIPFGQAASPLGMAALEAHRPDKPLPDPTATLTNMEFIEKYLLRLARTDLLYESILVHSRVVSVSRLQARRETSSDIQDRADIEYRLAIQSRNRGWHSERADIVLDCSGVGLPRGFGPGGGLATYGPELAPWISTGIRNVLGKEKAEYAGKRILVVGVSLPAIQNVLALQKLQQLEPNTRVTWLVPLDYGMQAAGDWLKRLADFGQAGQQLAERPEVRQALQGNLDGVVTLEGLGVERLAAKESGLTAWIQSDEDNMLDVECDRLINNMGYEPDWEHARPLRVGQSSQLCRPIFDQAPSAAEPLDPSESILTLEPHYYVLGSKSFGLGHDGFTLAEGHQQIRRAFAIIGGRENLDLYSNIQR